MFLSDLRFGLVCRHQLRITSRRNNYCKSSYWQVVSGLAAPVTLHTTSQRQCSLWGGLRAQPPRPPSRPGRPGPAVGSAGTVSSQTDCGPRQGRSNKTCPTTPHQTADCLDWQTAYESTLVNNNNSIIRARYSSSTLFTAVLCTCEQFSD